MTDVDKTQFSSEFPVDKIISDFDGNTTTFSVAAATLSGGFYLPKVASFHVDNPAKQKALFTMVYSYDGGVNYYPNRARLYNPGNPIPAGRIGASVGMAVDEGTIWFYVTHYIGAQVDFIVKWALDSIV